MFECDFGAGNGVEAGNEGNLKNGPLSVCMEWVCIVYKGERPIPRKPHQ